MKYKIVLSASNKKDYYYTNNEKLINLIQNLHQEFPVKIFESLNTIEQEIIFKFIDADRCIIVNNVNKKNYIVSKHHMN